MNRQISDIELARPEDLDEVLDFINETNKEWFIKIIPQEHWYEPFLTEDQFSKMCTFMDFFIRRYEENIIAVGSFATKNEDIAWIPIMYVRTDFHRKGIGSGLMTFLEDMARRRKHSWMQIETDGDAYWALDFYRKHGYSIFEKKKNPWGYQVWLEKRLTNE